MSLIHSSSHNNIDPCLARLLNLSITKQFSTKISVPAQDFIHRSFQEPHLADNSSSAELIEKKLNDMKVIETVSTGLNSGISESYVVTLEDGTRAIFKPKLHKDHMAANTSNPSNEVLAYQISSFFNFHLVPPVVIRKIQDKVGSLAYAVTNTAHAGNSNTPTKTNELMLQEVFDWIIGNIDRVNRVPNYLVRENGEVFSIDHGYLQLSEIEVPSDYILPEGIQYLLNTLTKNGASQTILVFNKFKFSAEEEIDQLLLEVSEKQKKATKSRILAIQKFLK